MHTPLIGIAVLLLSLAPSYAFEFSNAVYHTCYDADTCKVSLPSIHPLFGKKINVRIAGIDTPEIKGTCEREKALAKKARDFVRNILKDARRIDLLDAKRGKYFRIVAKVVADGNDIGETLIDGGWP